VPPPAPTGIPAGTPATTQADRAIAHPAAAAADGWQARLRLELAPRGGRTALVRKTQQGPLTVQRGFYPEGAPCHLYLLHPPGGVVGGDRIDLEVRVASGAHALLTMPGATKCYRSAGPVARQAQVLQVAAGGVLEWLPQESILFPGARLAGQLQVHLSGDARFIGWELLSLGRPSLGERFAMGSLDLRLALTRDGQPLLGERLCIDDGVGLDGPSGLRGLPIVATLLATGGTAADLAAARACSREIAAAAPNLHLGSSLLDDLLLVRVLAAHGEPVLRGLRALWQALRPRLLGRAASPPRIWAT